MLTNRFQADHVNPNVIVLLRVKDQEKNFDEKRFRDRSASTKAVSWSGLRLASPALALTI